MMIWPMRDGGNGIARRRSDVKVNTVRGTSVTGTDVNVMTVVNSKIVKSARSNRKYMVWSIM
jgi:hypothetical protein